MTDEQAVNEEVIRRYCDAWSRGDLAALVDCYHDDFTLHYFGQNPLAGDHVGKPAALMAMAQVQQRTNRRLLEITDAVAGRNRGVVLARERFERDGQTRDFDRVLVYRIEDGKLRECWIYDEDQRAVDIFFA